MNEHYKASKAVNQIKEIFDVLAFEAEYIDNLCCEGGVFLDNESPDWKQRYDHISLRYRRMIEIFRDHIDDIGELYKLKSNIEAGILKDIRKTA